MSDTQAQLKAWLMFFTQYIYMVSSISMVGGASGKPTLSCSVGKAPIPTLVV